MLVPGSQPTCAGDVPLLDEPDDEEPDDAGGSSPVMTAEWYRSPHESVSIMKMVVRIFIGIPRGLRSSRYQRALRRAERGERFVLEPARRVGTR